MAGIRRCGAHAARTSPEGKVGERSRRSDHAVRTIGMAQYWNATAVFPTARSRYWSYSNTHVQERAVGSVFLGD